jgi:two-component system sensor histidine kinase YesM
MRQEFTVMLKFRVTSGKHLSIRAKMGLLVFAVCLVLTSLVFFTSSAIYEQSIRSKTIGYNLDTIQTMNNNINTYFKEIERTAILLSNSGFVQAKFVHSQTGTLYEKLNLLNDMENMLKLIESLHSNLQISIFLDDGSSYYLSAPTDQINYEYKYMTDDWYKYVSGNNIWKTLYRHNIQSYYLSGYRKPVISYIQKFHNIYTLDAYGYIVMDINMKQFEAISASVLSHNESMSIVDRDGDIVYSSVKQHLPFDLSGLIPKEQSSGHMEYQYKDQTYLIMYDTSAYTGWKIYNVVSLSKLTKEIHQLRNYFLIFLVIVFVFVVGLFQFLTIRYITNPIRRLALGVQRLKKGKFDVFIPIETRDEIGLLTNEFNQMVRRIDVLIKENKFAEVLRKDAQLEMLQQQINPHFLYNTIETVIGMSSEGQSDKAIIVCTKLGNMLRYNLNGRKMVKLEDEVNQIRDYVDIMSLRFEGKFTVRYDIEQESLENLIPKFILQPLIENAIHHGLQDKQYDGLLGLEISCRKGILRIAIQDNGKGMTCEVLDLLNSKLTLSQDMSGWLQSDPSAGSRPSLGIFNVHFRLKLQYGEGYEMNIDSREGVGTNIVLCINLQKEIIQDDSYYAS